MARNGRAAPTRNRMLDFRMVGPSDAVRACRVTGRSDLASGWPSARPDPILRRVAPVLFVSDEVEAEFGPRLGAVAPGYTRFASRVGGPEPDLSAIELLYFSGDIFPARAREFAVAALKAPNLRWLHTFSAGVDDPFFGVLRERGVRLSTSSGAHAVPIAQTVILYLLALSRDLPGWLGDQAARRWNPRAIRDLQGLHVGVLGLGPIGTEVARLSTALGMRVTGVRRAPQGDESCETVALSALDGLLPQLDALVVALPLCDQTRGLIDSRRLALLPPGALFVNVGRGPIVDEPALIDALGSGRLGGAGLDVFAEEPLASTSPLWTLPNVIVTPHSSGNCPENQLRATEIFLENLDRYTRGEPLRNEVGATPGAAL
jgi:D-2-hydroxyacid dehydrogenase (NADP+)